MIAFVALAVTNGNVLNPDSADDAPSTTLVNRPVLPGDEQTNSTLGGITVRCKDGTYSFKSGGDDVSDEEQCKDNGGVDQRLK